MNYKEELTKLENQHQDLMKQFEIIRTNLIRIEGVMGFLRGKQMEEERLKTLQEKEKFNKN